MLILYILSGILLTASFIADKKKTAKALKIAWKKFRNIAPAFGIMLVLISIALFLVPEDMIIKYLGSGDSIGSVFIAALLGSIAMFPGFIAFPLCGIILENGGTWTVIAAFSTSLMLVGVVTFPVEKQFLGFKTALIRNIIAFTMVFIIALVVGIVYGEIF